MLPRGSHVVCRRRCLDISASSYGNERIVAYLFIPKNAAQPYQTVVYFPHVGGFALRSFEQAEMSYLGFLVKDGRALLFPMVKGMYERRVPPPSGPNAVRDVIIQQMKDLQRSVDYLQTRRDIAADRLAYFGVSFGAAIAPVALAVERRFRCAALWSGGFRLVERYRAAVVLCDLEEQPAREAARVLRVDERAVRQRGHRARLMLRGYLDAAAHGVER